MTISHIPISRFFSPILQQKYQNDHLWYRDQSFPTLISCVAIVRYWTSQILPTSISIFSSFFTFIWCIFCYCSLSLICFPFSVPIPSLLFSFPVLFPVLFPVFPFKVSLLCILVTLLLYVPFPGPCSMFPDAFAVFCSLFKSRFLVPWSLCYSPFPFPVYVHCFLIT